MNMKYFADINNKTIEFEKADYRKDGIYGFDNTSKQWIKVTRKINYKNRPSKHKCNNKCLHASGTTMNCECACGGKNHGKGYS